MAVLRSLNTLGQARLDVPHLRSLESAIAADVDLLAGRIMAGGKPLVVTGFDIVTIGAVGSPASALQLNVASGIILHYLASEHGTIFSVAADQPVEVLNSTNTSVSGSFTASQTNYVGLDLRRVADTATADLVMFLDANTLIETPKSVPLARVLKYKIIISTTDFSSTPYLLPIAKVTTNSTNTVTVLEDARPMAYRLGSGSSVPDRYHTFPWASGRAETTSGAVFAGGDKGISCLKDWMDAVMTRLWEVGGGQYWYSATSDRELKLLFGQPVIPATGDNFQWTLGSSTLAYQSLAVAFANSPVAVNTIVDGSAVLADGQCLYVDINRTTVAAVVPQVGDLTTMGTPTVPGSRFVIAWRRGSYVFTREKAYEVGRVVPVANTIIYGTVRLKYAAGNILDPTVLAMDANGAYSNVADAANSFAFFGTGNGSGPGLKGTGGSTDGSYGGVFTSLATNGNGVHGTATGSGVGGRFDASGAGQTALQTGTGLADLPLIDRAGTIGIGTANATAVTVGRSGQVLNLQNTWQVSAGGVLQAQGGNRVITAVADASLGAGAQDAVNKATVRAMQPRAKNLIINGGMSFWQRGQSLVPALTTTTLAYTADRWAAQAPAASFNTVTRQTSGLKNFRWSLRFQRSPGDADTGARILTQEIDREFLYWFLRNNGTDSAACSIWVKTGANFTGSITCNLRAGSGAEANSFRGAAGYTNQQQNFSTPTFSPTTTWTQFSFSASAITDSIGGTPNQASLEIQWIPSAVSAGANEWFEITGVMLAAESYDYPTTFVPAGGSVVAEQALCMRYFEKSWEPDTVPGTNIVNGSHYHSVSALVTVNGQDWCVGSFPRFKVTKRASPTVQVYSLVGTLNSWSLDSDRVSAANIVDLEHFTVANNTGGNITPTASRGGGHWTADAEFY